jgi:cytochrome P450
MATTSWLYELARAPANRFSAERATKASSSFRILDTEWITSHIPAVPDFSQEIDQVKNTTKAFLNQTYIELDERLHLQEHYEQVEARVAEVSQDVGLGHVPPSLLLQSLVVGLLLLIVVVSVARKIHRRRKHQRLYGNNAFPPVARVSMFRMARHWMNGSKELPWLWQDCAKSVDSAVFQLRNPSWVRQKPMVVAVGELHTAKEILQDPETTKPQASAMAAMVGGQPNILTSEGPQWKLSRKAISPAFLKQYLDRMHHVCKEETEEWISQKLKLYVEKQVDFDIGKELVLLTLSIICHAAFDYKVSPEEGKAVVHELAIVSREYGMDDSSSFMRSTFGILFPSVRRARKARKRLQEFSKKVLQTYRKNKGKNKAALEDTIISCIARNTKYEDDSRRIADIVMFLFSGVDNTAYSLAWTLIELAKHPSEAQKLKTALNGNDDFRAQEMLKDVLREGMRLRPPVPGIGMRTLGRDFYVADKSMVIPKGSQVFFPSLVMTRFDVDDPETFRPSRWRQHPDKSFLLFSTGRRNCVGQSLALAEITWVLSRLCAKYEFQITEEGSMEYSGTMKCVGTRLIAKSVKKNHSERQ